MKIRISKETKLIYLLTSVLIIGLSATDIYLSSLPEMTFYFRTTADIVNMTLSAFFIGLAIGNLFAGTLSDRYGRRGVLLWANGLFVIFTFIIVLPDSITLIIILRFLQSLCVSFNMLVTRQIIKDYFPPEKQIAATATMLTGVILSPALAPVAGAYLATLFDWRSCFIVSAFSGLIIYFWLYIGLPETNARKLNKLPNMKEFLKSSISLMFSKRFSGYIGTIGCAYATYFAFITISSYVFITQYGTSQRVYSYVFFVLAGAYLVGNYITKQFALRQYNSRQTIMLGCYMIGLGGIVNFIYFIAPSNAYFALTIFTVGAIISRVGIAITIAPLQVLVMNDYNEKSGQAIGLYYFFMYVFEALAAIIVSLFHRNPALGLVTTCAIFSLFIIPIWKAAMSAGKNLIDFGLLTSINK